MVANSRETHFLRRGDVHFALDSRSRRALVSRFLASIARTNDDGRELLNASFVFTMRVDDDDDDGARKSVRPQSARARRRTWRLSCTG